MNIRPFPSCCAGVLLTDFGGTNRILSQTERYSDEEMRDFFKLVDTKLIRTYGFAMLTLNNEQMEFMPPFLEEFGYECIASNLASPNHFTSKVFIYIKRSS